MTQFVVNEFPPMYEQINSRFGLSARRDVIFSWGPDLIYNPFAVFIPDQLLAHEAVHGERVFVKRIVETMRYADFEAADYVNALHITEVLTP